MAHEVNVQERAGGIYTNEVTTRSHKILTDEPTSFGSADLGLTPFELMAAGLGSCTSITLRMYSNRKEWPVEHISVDVIHSARGAGANAKHKFERRITVTGDLDEKQRNRIVEIANRCPVHRMLEGDIEIETVIG